MTKTRGGCEDWIFAEFISVNRVCYSRNALLLHSAGNVCSALIVPIEFDDASLLSKHGLRYASLGC